VWMLIRAGGQNTTTLTNRNTVECEVWIRKARDGVRDACVYLDFDRRQQWFAGKERQVNQLRRLTMWVEIMPGVWTWVPQPNGGRQAMTEHDMLLMVQRPTRRR